MKTKVSFITRMMTIAVVLVMTSAAALADGGTTDIYTTGTSTVKTGDFVVRTTSDTYHFQGEAYDVYNVYYDNPEHNLKIAVKREGKCNSFIAYTNDFTMFYDCTREGFGIRKVMFSNPYAHEQFDHGKFHDQTILCAKRKIDRKHAIELIACYLPMMQTT